MLILELKANVQCFHVNYYIRRLSRSYVPNEPLKKPRETD